MNEDAQRDLPGFADVEAAAGRLAGKALVTPLHENHALNEQLGGRILIKPETLQRTGSFKFRGAYNKISQLTADERARGVIAYSSGNHAQGVAAAARLLGIQATIVMPADAPAIKLANTRGYGATVITYDRMNEDREAIAENLMAEKGLTLIRPYDDPDIIAGQGTCGLEIVRQAEVLDATLDAVLVCGGGGGLGAGIGLALKALSPQTALYLVEPEGWDANGRSLAQGARIRQVPDHLSICDALMAPMPGTLTFALNSRHGARGLAVDDSEVLAAMAYALKTLKLVVEPGGAVALAALLAGRLEAAGKTIAIVLTGGNADPEILKRALEEGRTLS